MDALHAKEEDLIVSGKASEIDSLKLVGSNVGTIRHAEQVSQVDAGCLLATLYGSLEETLSLAVLNQLKVANAYPTVIVGCRCVQQGVGLNPVLEVLKIDPALHDAFENGPRHSLLDQIGYSFHFWPGHPAYDNCSQRPPWVLVTVAPEASR
jgi:hypothetical protein